MQINLNPTSERGASRDAVNRPRETLGDSHLISSDPRSRFGLVCDLLCCRGDIAMKRRKKPLAMKVFEAALTKGDHLDFLTKKFEKLKQGHWSPDPRK